MQRLAELEQENLLLRKELKLTRDAAKVTSQQVVLQFEKAERILQNFQDINASHETILEAVAQLSLIATDLDGTITLFNKGASNLLGYSVTEALNHKNIFSIYLEDDLKAMGHKLAGNAPVTIKGMQIFDQLVRRKMAQAQNWHYHCKHGELLPVSVSITGIFDANGERKGYLHSAMDISQHTQLERNLILAKHEADQANNAKTDFLARMSHEIRTPMNGIIGMATLLCKTQLNATQYNYAHKVLKSSNILLQLINDILDFSRINAGKLQLEHLPFDLDEVFMSLNDIIGQRIEEKSLELIFNIDVESAIQFVGDAFRLGQILVNLVGNALKFTEQGTIVVSVICKEHANNSALLQFSVRDTGIGLKQEQIAGLFDEFKQADDSITRKYGGTGLGLSICKQLVQLMDGEIWVESVLGKGTEFFFTIRVATKEIQPELPQQEKLLNNLHVLVVDDSPIAQDALSKILQSLHMRVSVAHSGYQALDLIFDASTKNDAFDLVLLDWIMPGLDGIETARQIHAISSLKKMPALLMVTANGREEVEQNALKAGIAGFLIKPVCASVILDTILNIVGIENRFIAYKPPQEAETAKTSQSLQGAHVLLVEDNLINQEIAQTFLEEANIIVSLANHGQEALEMVKMQNFDLVLMDIQMPVMDGLTATRILREQAQFAQLPIIAMTAHAMSGDREKSLIAGMNDHLTKPINVKELHRVLLRWISPKPAVGDEIASTTVQIMQSPSGIIPSLPGIDVARTLKYLNNNEHLLLKILWKFKRDNTDAIEQFNNWLVDKNWSEMQFAAHTLKGVAAYLNADDLRQAAAELESALKMAETDQAKILFFPFIDALIEVINGLATLPPIVNLNHPDEQPSTRFNATQVITELEQLLHYLNEGEVAAEQCVEQLLNALNGQAEHISLMQQISTAVDDLDYERASNLTTKLISNLT